MGLLRYLAYAQLKSRGRHKASCGPSAPAAVAASGTGTSASGEMARALRRAWSVTAVFLVAALFAVSLAPGAAAQIVRDIEEVIVDQSVIIRKYTPPPRRGRIRVNVIDLKAAQLPPGALQQRFVLNSLRVEDATLVPAAKLAPLWADKLGEAVTVEDILAIASEIENVYRRAGYFVIAAVPDQRFSSGNVRIVMFEDSFLNTVEFRSDRTDLEQRLQPYIQRIVEMRPLRVREIERILLLMSDLAGMYIEATVVRPEIPGDGGTLILEVDFTRGGANLGLDNRGSDEVGPLQASGQAYVNDILGLFESTSLVLATVPDKPRELRFGQISQEVPIGTNGLRVGYNVSAVWSEPGGDLSHVNVDVKTAATNVYASYPLLRRIKNSVYGRVEFSTDDNAVDIMGRKQARNRYRWLGVGGKSTHDLPFGGLEFNATYIHGLDVLSASEREGRFNSIGRAIPEFNAVQGGAVVTANLTDSVVLTGRATGQFAFDTLPSPVRFSFGGDPFGRAFDQAAISGDSGIALSGEIAVNHPLDFGIIQGGALFAFADYGYVINRGSRVPYNDADLASTGVGVRARLKQKVMAEASLGVPIEKISDAADPGVRVFFKLGKAF